MTRRTSKAFTYYACRTYTDSAKDGKEPCKKHSIRLDRLEKAVLAAIQVQIGLALSLEETIARINGEPDICRKSGRLEALLNARNDELVKCQNLCDGLYPDMKSGLLTLEEYRRLKATHQDKMAQIKEAINQIAEELSIYETGVEAGHPYFEHFRKYQNVEGLDRNLLIALVDTIYIHKGGNISIKFLYADQHKRILEFIENNARELMVLEGGRASA